MPLITGNSALINEQVLIRTDSNWGPPMTYAANLGLVTTARSAEGTVTITTLTVAGASGTFSFAMAPDPDTQASGMKAVTNGVFDEDSSDSLSHLACVGSGLTSLAGDDGWRDNEPLRLKRGVSRAETDRVTILIWQQGNQSWIS